MKSSAQDDNGNVRQVTFVSLVDSDGVEYEAVAASVSDQPLGPAGAAGDFLSHLVIQPATTSPGSVTLKDGGTTVYTYPGGTVSDTGPIIVPFNAKSKNGAWTVTTGANVSIFASGNFT